MIRFLSIATALAMTLIGAVAARADYVYYYPTYGPLYSGPLVNNLGSWRNVNRGGFAAGGTYRPTYAIAGVNSPAIGKSEVRTTTGLRTATAAKQTREQDALNARLEDLMKEKALVTGTVVRVGATAVSVKLEEGKKTRNERFDFDQVFFFRGGQVTTAGASPNILQPGDRVLVPQAVNQ